MSNAKHRIIQFSAGVLADKDLSVISLSGSEGISELFSFAIEMTCADDVLLDASSILGQPTTVLLEPGSDKRWISGLVSELEYLDQEANGSHRYRATLVPELWFNGLAIKTRTHVYTQMSAADITDKLLGQADLKVDFTNKVKLSHKFDLTTIQYNESDLDFLLRFLAKAGISFYFEHKNGQHKMVLLDDSSHFPESKTLHYDRSGAFASDDKAPDVAVGWSECFSSAGAKVTWGAYDNVKSSAASAEALSKHKIAGLSKISSERFGQSIPNLTTATGDKAALAFTAAGMLKASAKIAQNRENANYNRANTRSNCPSLYAGALFNLDPVPRKGIKQLLVTRISHSASDGYDGVTEYQNSIECIDGTLTPAPADEPAPRIYGHLQAKVVETQYGGGEPTVKAKGGMVKVVFPWDEKTTSHWIQVSQMFGGGKTAGAWFLPQMDDLVLVGFINGEPEYPVVVGTLYHQATDFGPTFANDSEKGANVADHRMGLRHPAEHELSFTGQKKGDGEVYINSSHDFNRIIGRHETAKIEETQEQTITSGDTRVYMDKEMIHLSVGKSSFKMEKNGDITVDCANFKLNASAKITTDSGADTAITAGANLKQKASSKVSIDSGTDTAIKAGTNLKAEGGINADVKAGANASLKGGANADVKAGAMLNLKGSAMGTLDGGGMTTIKGGMVMIN